MNRSKKTSPAQRARRRAFTRQFYRGNGLWLACMGGAVLLMAAANLGISWMMQQIIDLTTGSGALLDFPGILAVALLLVAACLVMAALGAVGQSRFLSRALAQYRDYVYRQMLKKDLAVFLKTDSAAWLSALTNDVGSIEANYLLKWKDILGNGLLFVGALAMMFFYSPLLAVIALALGALPLCITLVTGPKIAQAEAALSDENQRFVAAVKESLTGFSVIKTFRAESQALELFAQDNSRLQQAKKRRVLLSALLTSLGSLAQAVSQIGLFIIGCWLCLTGEGLTPGALVIFMDLTGITLLFVTSLPDFLANRAACMALIDKLDAMLQQNDAAPAGRAMPRKLSQSVTLQNLSFGYTPDTPVLNGLNAVFAAGKSYAVVGASGSGKSTLLGVLMSKLTGYTGSITLDGVELADVAADSLYDLMALVDQNVFVFDRSIRDNITMFREFPDEEVERAVRLSGLGALVAEKGEDYRCGENGANLSGGERQRISIARSLLRRAPVLLVDEATAALDKETAFQVAGAILDLENITRIVVTHNLDERLLRRYDGILVLKNGALTEQGTFQELMAARGYFYSLYTVSQ